MTVTSSAGENRRDGVAQTAAKPVVSVVTVIDFAYAGTRTHDDVKATMAALAAQDFEGPFEVLLCESAIHTADLPHDLHDILPSLKILSFPDTESYALMNAGARAAAADIVAFVDGDCTPEPDWLRHLVDTLTAHPEISGVTGLTTYATTSFRDRIMALLSRSYVHPGRAGRTRYFSNNNGGMRRDVWLRHPLPTNAGPYASRLQTEAIQRAGGRFYFQPRMRLVHDYEGWAMERDLRMHHGFCTVMTRRIDPAMPHAWLVRPGIAAIPILVAAKTLSSWADCLRCARAYGVRWAEIPVAMVLSMVLHLFEVPGMVQAFRDQPITRTRYR